MRISAAVLLLTLPAAASAAGEGDEYQFERRSRRDHRRDMEVEAIVVPASNPAASVAVAASAAAAGGLDLEIDNLNMGDGTTRATTLLRPIQVWADGCTIEDAEGTVTPCDNGNVILVSNDDEQDLVVLTSNPTTGETSGFVSSSGATYGVSQMQGGYTKAEPPTGTAAIPENWSCHMDAPPENRRLLAEGLPGHDHHAHDHHDHDHHAHDHDHFNLDNLNEAFEKEGIRLRGSSKEDRPGRKLLYYTDDFPKRYSYQVDVFIEYDSQLVANNGGTTAGVQQYIADLMAGANIIYEKEIDTHLEVSGMLQTNRYDSSGNTSQALDVLRNARMGSNFPAGANLVHALLGRQLGGGIAYLNALCNTNIGFGVSAGIVGAYEVGPNAMVWDIVVFTHELGHNFGTGHTHEYSPAVDSCGSTQCGGGGLPNNGAATLMGYCHLCSGGTNNVAPSFGGHRDESTGNWINDPLVASKGFSVDPKRVPQSMHSFVSSRGSCVAPQGTVPNQQAECTSAEDCDDGNACTVDTCDTSDTSGGLCVHVDTCPSEAPSAAPTCGGDKIVVEIKTDNYPFETSWTLVNTCVEGGEEVMSGGPYTQGASTFSDELCTDTGRYRFTLNDVHGDGICCGYGQGSYKITMAGIEVASGGQFGATEVKEFGSCGSAPTPAPPTPGPTIASSNAPSAAPSNIPSEGPSAVPSSSPTATPTVAPTAAPTVAPSIAISAAPSTTPTVEPPPTPPPPTIGAPTSAPTVSPTPPPPPTPPPGACTDVTISILTDRYPYETTWDVKDASGTNVMTGGPYTQRSTTFPETACLSDGQHTFTIDDSYGDGICCKHGKGAWSIVLADSGLEIGSGREFENPFEGTDHTHTFMLGVPPPTPPPPPPTPPGSCTDVSVTILTDNYPRETTWSVKDAGGNNVMKGGPYSQSSQTFAETACLEVGQYAFIIDDSYGDGICCQQGQGKWSIALADSCFELESGGSFNFKDELTFEVPENLGGSQCFRLDLLTDTFPGETTWEVASANTGAVYVQGGPYNASSKAYTETVALPVGDCYEFKIYDSWGDGICCREGNGGAEISLNGAVIGSAGAFGREWTSNKFGDACVAINFSQ